jgi:hypothetical protein
MAVLAETVPQEESIDLTFSEKVYFASLLKSDIFE